MNLTFNRTLLIGFGISLLLLILTSAASYISISNLLKSADRVNHTNNVIIKLDALLSTMKDAETGQRGFLITGDPVFLEPYTGAYEKTLRNVEALKELMKDNPQQLQNIHQLENLFVKRLSRLQVVIEAKKENGIINPEELREGKRHMDSARELVRNMTAIETTLLEQRSARMDKFSAYTPALIITAAIFAIFITLFSFNRIRSEFKERQKLQEELEAKNKETAHRIDILQNLADKIARGDYTIRLNEEEKDGLGSLSYSLNKMAGSLQFSFDELSSKEWLQTGIADLNNLMVGEQDIDSLTSSIISFLTQYTQSHTGAIYIKEGPDTLMMSGSFAIQRSPGNIRIKLGEGLAGQSAISGKELMLNEVPEESFILSFASGEARPGYIIALPVLYDNVVTAVLELASFTPFTKNQLIFLKNGAHNIGVAINSSQNRKKLQELLEETQSQAEELQAQHSEMENLNEELESQTQKLQASEEELRVQQEELMQSNQELEERSRLLEEKNYLIGQRNLEIQKKAEELALSTKYKSEFLANMSHELRTPLNSILLLSRLMSENKDNHLNSEDVSYAKVIRSSGEGLLTLIDEILDLSKIESGKMNLEINDVQLKEVLDDMYSLFTPMALDKDLELRTNISLDTPEMIRTDKMRLEQILKNLLSNSLKFTSKGYISLDIHLSAFDNRYVNFIVKDTGIGIAYDKQQLVFEAFQQEDGSTRRKYGGTGLGLSISRELTRLLGGEISLTSEPGKGTEFTVSIPVNETVPKKAEPLETFELKEETVQEGLEQIEEKMRYLTPTLPSSIPDDRENINQGDKVILIIEDDTNFASALISFSRQNGYKVLAAVSGDEGIDLAKTYRPLAILLDIVLPVKDGWEVMEELKASPLTRHIPVHIMSSMEAKREGLLKGAVDYISKPVAMEKISAVFEKLEAVLNRENKKVLIIEENTNHAKALSFFLESFDVKSEIRDSIPASITALQEMEANCVILDMGIPDENVYETLEKIKKNPGLENLPIIIFTGKHLSSAEQTRIKRYADSIVVKTAHSYQRILDEVSLFLHLIGETKNPRANSNTYGALHDVLKNKKVLIADDDVRNIFSLTKILEKYKMKVVSATDGKEAVRQVMEDKQIDLVLMDMMMPEMDGYEAIRTIRKSPKFNKLPILAVTAKAMMGDREKCINAGASDYISKPVDLDQLVSLLRVWLYDRDF